MVLRDELTTFLKELYQYENFQDKCENGLQVEGKEKIEKIVFGVSFSLPFLEQALEKEPDAIIVHHGIFQPGVFKLTNTLKHKVKLLIERDISLYGIHLPMDGHPTMGHGSLLLSYIGARRTVPYELGAMGENAREYKLTEILKIFHQILHPKGFELPPNIESAEFNLFTKYGFTAMGNGPETPKKIVVMSGGGAGFYEKAIEQGVDTYITGEIKEKVATISLETKTNFVNIGHYFSEKPGILTLKKRLAEKFSLDTEYIEIFNPI